jgi:TrmH family RNA methyltransferase
MGKVRYWSTSWRRTGTNTARASLLQFPGMRRPAIAARIVLVRPRNPLNIGAAARAMSNFGFDDLVVVRPHAPVWRETRSALGAQAVMRSARAVDNLLEAIGDSAAVVGTTSGARRTLDRELVPLPELSRWLAARVADSSPGRGRPRKSASGPTRVAVLFGSEKTGLSNEHLSYCHALVRIPTVPGCPSMNLGQAVAVCCYELARGRAAPPPLTLRVHRSVPAPMHSLEHIFERAARLLDAAGYLKPKSRASTLLKLRRLLLDLDLSNSDVRILGGVLAQLEWRIKA